MSLFVCVIIYKRLMINIWGVKTKEYKHCSIKLNIKSNLNGKYKRID